MAVSASTTSRVSTAPERGESFYFSGAALVLVCVGILVVLGLTILYSASRALQLEAAGQLLARQILWLFIAGGAGVTAALLPLERVRGLTWLILAVSIGLLAAVLHPSIGSMVNGARRWISLGFINIQASEFAKVGLLFCLSHYLAAHQRYRTTVLRGFLVPLALVGLWSGLILLQPDFGTAALCGAVGISLLFLYGSRLSLLVPSAGLLTALFGLLVYLDPVRFSRILAFLDVEGNRSGSAYQLWQGLLAFASGGLQGTGLGNGRQQLHYLPEAHTDFIFAILGEELGLLFSGGTVLLFLCIFVAGSRLLGRAPNLYQYLLIQGALLFITGQALFNFCVVTGLLPTKGISLPFISYGGSNLVVMFFMVGLLINAFRTWGRPVWSRPSEL